MVKTHTCGQQMGDAIPNLWRFCSLFLGACLLSGGEAEGRGKWGKDHERGKKLLWEAGSRSLFTVTKEDISIVKNSTISVSYRQPFPGRGILILLLA